MKQYFDYLDRLRQSGETNMYGAVPNLQREFPELGNPKRAGQILLVWMSSFGKSNVRKEGRFSGEDAEALFLFGDFICDLAAHISTEKRGIKCPLCAHAGGCAPGDEPLLCCDGVKHFLLEKAALCQKELQGNGWEITTHANNAPDHEPIQGKQYPDAEYQALNNSLVRRIGTLNYGHAAFPIILGVNRPQYTPEELEEFRTDNEKGVTVDGVRYTGYQATQMQRKLERSIRAQKLQVMADEAAGDGERLAQDKSKLTVQQQRYAEFSKAANLRTQEERTEVAGFGEKSKATAQMGKPLDKSAENITISSVQTSGVPALRKVCDLNIETYKCVAPDITAREVIITDERIQHIKDHHPGHFEIIEPFLQRAIDAPDYILADAPNTGLILKLIEEDGMRMQIVLRLHTSADSLQFKNPIISAWKISETRWKNYLRNKTILYKSK